jgi:very-short-patch-repair endonuclease
VGTLRTMAKFRPRDTQRARELRNQATPAERQLWRYLARGQLGAKFSRQMPVGPYFADFLCRELMLVVELDGFSHEMRQEADAVRTRVIEAAGYRVLRFTNAEVLGNVEGVAWAIQTVVMEVRSLAHP